MNYQPEQYPLRPGGYGEKGVVSFRIIFKNGDSKSGNKQYKTIHSIYLVLKKENRLDELLELLDHENPYVRSWAAEYTLQISPSKAEKALEELVDIKSKSVGFNAMMIL